MRFAIPTLLSTVVHLVLVWFCPEDSLSVVQASLTLPVLSLLSVRISMLATKPAVVQLLQR